MFESKTSCATLFTYMYAHLNTPIDQSMRKCAYYLSYFIKSLLEVITWPFLQFIDS